MISATKINTPQLMSLRRLCVADTVVAHHGVPELVPLTNTGLSGGRYQIEGLLGTGGSGSVFLARDILLDERVAIKMMHDGPASSGRGTISFAKEVRLSRRISHRNVARTFDIGEESGLKFLTMEFVEGESLHFMLRPGRPLPPIQHVIAVGIEICKGLFAIHNAGVVHCDLKPDNILLTRDGRVVITDFGVAHEIAPPQSVPSEAGTSSGTPEYMSPEQIEKIADLDGRADIYALGIILYELLTGELPFLEKTRFLTAIARLDTPPPDPCKKRPSLPPKMAEIVLRCLARKREDRYANTDQIARALREVLDARHIAADSRQTPPRIAASQFAETRGV